jgi:hypothetical protein
LESKGYRSELGCKGGSIPPICKHMKLLHVVLLRALIQSLCFQLRFSICELLI